MMEMKVSEEIRSKKAPQQLIYEKCHIFNKPQHVIKFK